MVDFGLAAENVLSYAPTTRSIALESARSVHHHEHRRRKKKIHNVANTQLQVLPDKTRKLSISSTASSSSSNNKNNAATLPLKRQLFAAESLNLVKQQPANHVQHHFSFSSNLAFLKAAENSKFNHTSKQLR